MADASQNLTINGTAIDGIAGWLEEMLPALWLAKFLGAVAGSIVSLAYIMPRGRRAAASRLLVGLVTGLIFGGTAGVKAADLMGLLGKVSAFEIALMGATLSSLSAWWGLGVLQRLMERWPGLSLRPAPGANKQPDSKEHKDTCP